MISQTGLETEELARRQETLHRNNDFKDMIYDQAMKETAHLYSTVQRNVMYCTLQCTVLYYTPTL